MLTNHDLMTHKWQTRQWMQCFHLIVVAGYPKNCCFLITILIFYLNWNENFGQLHSWWQQTISCLHNFPIFLSSIIHSNKFYPFSLARNLQLFTFVNNKWPNYLANLYYGHFIFSLIVYWINFFLKSASKAFLLNIYQLNINKFGWLWKKK